MQIHLIADALGCQRKWYLSRSHLLCRSTTVNRMRVRTKFEIPFNSRGHLRRLFAVKTCLSRKRASTYSLRKHLARNHLVQYGCRVLLYKGTMVYRSTIIHAGSLGIGLQQGFDSSVSWLSVQVVLGKITFAVQERLGERQHHHACRFTPNLQYHSIVEAISAT